MLTRAYRQNFLRTQLFIAMCLLLLYFAAGMTDWPRLLSAFGVMQFFALLGGVIGERVRKRAERIRDFDAKG